jgi:hypothetical protein
MLTHEDGQSVANFVFGNIDKRLLTVDQVSAAKSPRTNLVARNAKLKEPNAFCIEPGAILFRIILQNKRPFINSTNEKESLQNALEADSLEEAEIALHGHGAAIHAFGHQCKVFRRNQNVVFLVSKRIRCRHSVAEAGGIHLA